MTKQTKITATEARFPLASLTLSEMNPRQNVSEQDIIELAGSIWAAGLIQNIAGLADKKGKAEIVAGGRRLALANLAEPIIEALAAGEISLSMAACFTICDDEKHSLEVLEQVRGNQYNDHHLKNMLKPDSVKGSDRRAKFVGEEAYKEAGGRMGGDLFTEETLFDSPEILDGCFQVALEDAAQKVAKTEGWKWVETVESPYFDSYGMGLDKFGRIYRVEGELPKDQAERYDELAAWDYDTDDAEEIELEALQKIVDGNYTADQKIHAGAYILVSHSGKLEINGGFIKPEDKKAAIEGGVLTASRHGNDTSAEPKSPISQKLAADLDRVARGARQNAALDNADLLLDLLAYQLSGGMGYRSAFGLRTDDGDSLYVRGRKQQVRLWGVDAPERDAAGFERATAMLSRLAQGQRITCREVDQDRYGRSVARCFLPDGREINRLMIESGTTREYRHFTKGFYSR